MDLWFKGINCLCPYLNGWCDVSLCWGYLNFQSPWILSRVFLRTAILFLQRIRSLIIILLFFGCCWSLLLPLGFLFFFLGCCSSSFASFSTIFFNHSCPYPIFPIILLYNKEAASRPLCSFSASVSRVAATGADTAFYNFEILFLKNEFIFYYYIFEKFPENYIDRTQITSKWPFYRCKKPMKTYRNSWWKITIQLLKLCLKLIHLSM